MKQGFVYIVGAGPGDPDLITVKGRRCVRRADVILHDRLIHPGVLAEARPKAILIDSGKRFGHEDQQQAERWRSVHFRTRRRGSGRPQGRSGSVRSCAWCQQLYRRTRGRGHSPDSPRLHAWVPGDYGFSFDGIRYRRMARRSRSSEGGRNGCRVDGSGKAGGHQQKPDRERVRPQHPRSHRGACDVAG